MKSLFLALAFFGFIQSTHAQTGIVASQVSCQYLQSAVHAGHTVIIGKTGRVYDVYDPCGSLNLFSTLDGLCWVRTLAEHNMAINCGPHTSNPNGGD